LRRSAIGILAIILDRGYSVSIPQLVAKSVALLETKRQRSAEEISTEVVEFIRLRLVNMLVAHNYPADVVEAVLSASFSEPVDAVEKIKALSELKSQADFEPLAVAFKRVGNIIKGGLEQQVDRDLFEAPCERSLYDALQKVEAQVATLVKDRDYVQMLDAIAGLRGPVDAFFDGVMVMADEIAVKNNRLALLTRIAALFKDIADFGRIA
jgi:glycyl-tRNA synthetase beta chain